MLVQSHVSSPMSFLGEISSLPGWGEVLLGGIVGVLVRWEREEGEGRER